VRDHDPSASSPAAYTGHASTSRTNVFSYTLFFAIINTQPCWTCGRPYLTPMIRFCSAKPSSERSSHYVGFRIPAICNLAGRQGHPIPKCRRAREYCFHRMCSHRTSFAASVQRVVLPVGTFCAPERCFRRMLHLDPLIPDSRDKKDNALAMKVLRSRLVS